MFALFTSPAASRSGAETRRARRRLAARLDRAVRRTGRRTIVCWGTGQMAAEVAAILLGRIAYCVDSDEARHGTTFFHRPVRPPSALQGEDPGDLVVLVASVYDEAILRQLATLLPGGGYAIVPVAPIHTAAWSLPLWRRLVPANAAPVRPATRRSSKRQGIVPRQRTLLVVGGYGYRNVGDEAQLAATLAELRTRFPGLLIKVLTPNPQRTHVTHGYCAVGDAPRVAFYDEDTSPLYRLVTRPQKLAFLIRSWWLLAHAWLVRAGIPLALVKPRRVALLSEIAGAELIVFSGGGYLTGATLSRLWDGAFLMRIAHVLGVPVVLSGQTIGLWNSRFTRRLARRALERTALIATRDGDASFTALGDLALAGPQVMVTCDDALFGVAAEDVSSVRAALEGCGINPAVAEQPYVVLNAHYFGVTGEDDRRQLVDRMASILDRLHKAGAPAIIGLPMVPGDTGILRELERARPQGWYRMLRTGDRHGLARAVIRGSRLCVSMKHHPIIFALGERVPAISLTLGKYYEHKNSGALGLVGLADCAVNLGDPEYLAQFDAVVARLAADRQGVVNQIDRALQALARQRAGFFDAVEEVVRRTRASRP